MSNLAQTEQFLFVSYLLTRSNRSHKDRTLPLVQRQVLENEGPIPHFVSNFLNDLEKPCLMSHPSSCKEECLVSMSESPNLSLAFPAGKWERGTERWDDQFSVFSTRHTEFDFHKCPYSLTMWKFVCLEPYSKTQITKKTIFCTHPLKICYQWGI